MSTTRSFTSSECACETAGGGAPEDERSVRTGFRELRVRDGWFELNGQRIYLRSTHTGNHYPIGQVVPQSPELVRQDLVYAKAAGFNMVRWIAGMAREDQLDFCDELGLMVYEETHAAWLLGSTPRLAEHFDRSNDEMVPARPEPSERGDLGAAQRDLRRTGFPPCCRVPTEAPGAR